MYTVMDCNVNHPPSELFELMGRSFLSTAKKGAELCYDTPLSMFCQVPRKSAFLRALCLGVHSCVFASFISIETHVMFRDWLARIA